MQKNQKRLLMITLTVLFTMTIIGATAATDSNNCDDRIVKNVTNCNGTNDNINTGDIVKYNITVTRERGEDNYYQVNDTLPQGLQFINATTYGTAANKGTYNNNTGMWTGIYLSSSSQYATLIIYAQVTDCGLTINNTARLYSREHSNYGSWDYVGRASSSFYVPKANVTIEKTGNGPLNVGQTGVFTIKLHNNGPNTAHNVVVTDVLPAGFTAGTPSQGYVVGGVWYVGNLTNGTNATLTISGLITQAMAGTNITNNVTETQDECNKESQEASATIYVKKCNLYVNVTPTNVSTTIGGTTTLTYKLGNNGPDTADNVVMQFVIPDGLEFVSANVDVGTYTYDAATRTLTWNLGNVPVGDPYLWLNVKVLRAGSFVINSDITSGTCTGQPVVISAVTVQAAGGEPEPVNAASNTIGMQNTGMPLVALILAVLLVGLGFVRPKK